jgi:trimethylamine--corrinoid protein Co-methyltransferase
MDALREVGPGGHFLGCAHTQANYKSAFWRTKVLDYRPFETWAEDGGKSSYELAADRVRSFWATTRRRCSTPAVDEALRDYMDRRKAEMPDAFI